VSGLDAGEAGYRSSSAWIHRWRLLRVAGGIGKGTL
jgi:hypothetical protein